MRVAAARRASPARCAAYASPGVRSAGVRLGSGQRRASRRRSLPSVVVVVAAVRLLGNVLRRSGLGNCLGNCPPPDRVVDVSEFSISGGLQNFAFHGRVSWFVSAGFFQDFIPDLGVGIDGPMQSWSSYSVFRLYSGLPVSPIHVT